MRDLAGRTLRHPEMPRAVANDLPDWLEPYLERVFGKGLEREMAALNGPAPIDLRVNLLKADRETARRALAAEGVAAEPTPLSPLGLRLRERVPLGNLAAFKQGLVEVQDESSQIAALLADARPGMRVVDFCAGAGGKTLALAAGMDNRGKLVACEVSQRRLERAGAPAAPRRRQQCRAPRAERRARQMGQAPRRQLRPGLRRRALPRHRHLAPQPRRQMAHAPRGSRRARRTPAADPAQRRAPRPPRRAPRSTRPARCCARKTRRRPRPFSPPRPDFALLPVARVWGETIGGASPGGEDYLRLTPARHGTDGFFVAIFERQPCPTAS